jgi:hypothetical protein
MQRTWRLLKTYQVMMCGTCRYIKMQTVLIFLLMALLEIETKSIIALGKTNEIAEQIPTVICCERFPFLSGP